MSTGQAHADLSSLQEWHRCLTAAARHQRRFPLKLLQRCDALWSESPDALFAIDGWETVFPAYLAAKHSPSPQLLAAIEAHVSSALHQLAWHSQSCAQHQAGGGSNPLQAGSSWLLIALSEHSIQAVLATGHCQLAAAVPWVRPGHSWAHGRLRSPAQPRHAGQHAAVPGAAPGSLQASGAAF